MTIKFCGEEMHETMSSDTLRMQDLIGSAIPYLEAALRDGKPYAQAYLDEANMVLRLYDALEDENYKAMFTSEAHEELEHQAVVFWHETLCDYFDGLAPVGLSFGSHPGDGALIGFWGYDTECTNCGTYVYSLEGVRDAEGSLFCGDDCLLEASRSKTPFQSGMTLEMDGDQPKVTGSFMEGLLGLL
jgi:hypothetical protein